MNRTKRRATIAIGLCVVALIAIIGLGVALSGNIVYYLSLIHI